MSDKSSHELRKLIRQTINQADGAPRRSEVVSIVSKADGATEAAVRDALDESERLGFVYCVGDEDPEVKLL